MCVCTHTLKVKPSLSHSPRSSIRNITDHCVNVSSTQCDFTTQAISPYGHYTGWVKALLGDQSSDWVTSEEFILDNESEDHPADLTPPPISASFLITCFPTVMLNNTQQRSVFLPFISPSLSLRQPSSVHQMSRCYQSGRPSRLASKTQSSPCRS